GGVAFGFVPVFGYVLVKRPPRWFPGVVLAGAAACVIMVPWMIWQRVEDPPGNALIKFALAGTYGLGEEHKTIWATTVDAFARLTLSDWLRMRWESVLTL